MIKCALLFQKLAARKEFRVVSNKVAFSRCLTKQTAQPRMENKPLIIFVLGGPGAGKGTQCEKIVEKFGFKHLSAGDLLREERRSGSEKGDMIETYIKDGKIVPVEITLGLLDMAMQKSNIKQFLIDGFPRNEDNFTGWNKSMETKVNFKFVLFFECSEETCVERILERGKSSGRSDDNRESLVKRFQTYTDSTTPIIDHYRKDNLVRTIDAEASADQVFEKVKELFQKEGLS